MATQKTLTKSIISFAALALSSAAISAPVSAQPISKSVAYGDLDLSSAKGQQRLEKRIKYAASSVCGERRSQPTPIKERKIVAECKAQAMQSAMSEARIAIANYKQNGLAMGSFAVVGN